MMRRNKAPQKEAAKDVAKAPPQEPSPEEPAEIEESRERIVFRPDGYYWQALDGQQEIGPFDTLAEAQADMESDGESAWVPGETLREAEGEIGIADWIDPETGDPAEGQAPPHFERE
jgi:hypothetical protein